jgi:O-antigen/teichoic acid export membrane protein
MRRPVTAEPASLAGNSARLLVAQVAGNGGWFVSVVLLARALEPAGRGTVAFVTVTALLTSRVAVLGSAEAGKVLAASRPVLRRHVLANLLVLTVATALAGAALTVALLLAVPGLRPAGVTAVGLAGTSRRPRSSRAAVASAPTPGCWPQGHGCSRWRWPGCGVGAR